MSTNVVKTTESTANSQAAGLLARAMANLQSARELVALAEKSVFTVIEVLRAPVSEPEAKAEEPTEEAPKG